MIASTASVPRVVAVVVAYRPDVRVFARLLASLATQVAVTLVADNARGEGLERTIWSSRLEHHDMQGNVGVAVAQNAGVRRARHLGASHVLFLDHDSVPSASLVDKLLAQSLALGLQGERVAAVGADYRDARHAVGSPFVAMCWSGYARRAARTDQVAVPVSFLISAGMLVSLEALADVGPMADQLFIDYVDIEWCMRAQAKGRRCFGIPGAMLEHRLGDDLLRWHTHGEPFRWLGRTVPSRSPLRHYYLFRNGCWLIVHGNMPLQWKLLELKRLLACFAAFATLASERRAQVHAMVRGIAHGLIGTLGPAR